MKIFLRKPKVKINRFDYANVNSAWQIPPGAKSKDK